jgi:hypothetical protein
MPYPMPDLDEFTKAYIDCALSSSTDEDGEPFDANWTVEQFTQRAIREMINDCVAFRSIPQVSKALKAVSGEPYNYPDENAGHDFWLTRNGHGVGFWDRGLGDLGDTLTAHSHSFGACYIYGVTEDGDEHNDNGMLHIA